MRADRVDTGGALPTYFISHGGGPWPWMKDEMPGVYDRLEASLKDVPRQLRAKPRAVLMISGHWEERDFTVMSSPAPPMYYDYGGFPGYDRHGNVLQAAARRQPRRRGC